GGRAGHFALASRGMIALFTDFGTTDPYVGQLHARLRAAAPEVPVIDLFHGIAPYNVRAAAYLLPAYASALPPGTVFLCVVDPGVGGARRPVCLEADDCWYVGPDNGLFALLLRRAGRQRAWEITWRPERLSRTFHGRDLFAPVAAELALGRVPALRETKLEDRTDWPDDLAEVIHVDHYGNGITGIRASSMHTDARVRVGTLTVVSGSHYAERCDNDVFWYENANGLVEIAAARGSAAHQYGLAIGTPVMIQ
ncbi:MAG: SAM hydrolase/SAM-dependent halogenase family protein, partial [Acidiferrobacteraceae bacterium]